MLVYDRIGGKYRLGFVEMTTESFEAPLGSSPNHTFGDPVPFDGAPREWKLEGIVQLPKLVTTLADEALRLAKNAETAVGTVNEILQDLSAAAKK